MLIGSANDYCGTYTGSNEDNNFGQRGPIWLGYYRTENGGQRFQSSLVPGYPGDTSRYADRAHIRTASAGDPVVAWDDKGRVFLGSESSDDPAGSLKTFGDEWGSFSFGTWTDLRNTVHGEDPREAGEEDADDTTADVKHCREHTADGWTGDRCPHDGGLDANTSGDVTP